MSIVVEVRFAPGRLPTPQAWQTSIETNGFAVEIERDFSPETFTGFLPARYKDQPAGFEYYYELETDQQSCVSLVWSGRAREAVCGIIAAACLCQLTAGSLLDTEAGETIEAPAVIAWARQCEADFEPILQKQDAQLTERTQPHVKPWWRLW